MAALIPITPVIKLGDFWCFEESFRCFDLIIMIVFYSGESSDPQGAASKARWQESSGGQLSSSSLYLIMTIVIITIIKIDIVSHNVHH